MIELEGFTKFLAAMEKEKDRPDRWMRIKLSFALQFVHDGVTSKTPVFTGQSLRNWVWSTGQPHSGGQMDALGSMAPGQTSKMRLGTEPRRPVNQAAVDASLRGLNTKNPYQSFWLSNNSETIRDLEYGLLPSAERSRSPAGMVRVTMQNLMLALEGGRTK